MCNTLQEDGVLNNQPGDEPINPVRPNIPVHDKNENWQQQQVRVPGKRVILPLKLPVSDDWLNNLSAAPCPPQEWFTGTEEKPF